MEASEHQAKGVVQSDNDGRYGEQSCSRHVNDVESCVPARRIRIPKIIFIIRAEHPGKFCSGRWPSPVNSHAFRWCIDR